MLSSRPIVPRLARLRLDPSTWMSVRRSYDYNTRIEAVTVNRAPY